MSKIIFLILLLVYPAGAQPEMRFEHLTVEDGLPENSVRKSLQDYQGFLWLATQNGLVRYDGYILKVYKPEPGDSSSIDGDLIHYIYEDRTRDLWIGTNNGLSRYNREKDEFENNILHSFKKENFIDEVSICEDDSGYLYIGFSEGGFFKYDKLHKTVTKFTHNPDDTNSISSNNIRCMYIENPGIIWIGTWGAGLDRFDIQKQNFKNYRNLTRNKNSISSNYLSSIYKDRAGNLWIGTNNGLNKFDKFAESFTSYGIKPGNQDYLSNIIIYSLYEDNYGYLWLAASGAGLLKFDVNKNSFIIYSHEPVNNSALLNNYVKDIYEDRSELIWIGNEWGGLNKYSRKTAKFTSYKNIINNKTSITGGQIGGIIEDRSGTIWIGTAQGFNKFDSEKNLFIRYEKIFGKVNTMLNNCIRALYEDSRGIIWIGTRDGLIKFSKNNGVIKIYKHDNEDTNSISSSDITFIYEDKKNFLWIGTMYGLNKLDMEKDLFKSYYHLQSDSNSISFNTITCIYEDKVGEFWIGTDGGGLNKFNRDNEIFKSYYFHTDFSGISAIYEDNKNRFWVTDYSAGLCLFDRSTGNITHFTEKEGLANNCAGAILEDNKGNLWIGTANGLSKFNPETKTFKNYKKIDGLLITNFYYGANLKDKDGFIYFGGEDGFVKFHPDSLEENAMPPPVVLTDFKVFNKSVQPSDNSPLKKNINVADEINLTYKENEFSIEFAALDYHSPMSNKYAYIMEGFNKEWIYTNARNRAATYTNLDPGHYTFRVKGSNNDGVWNEEGTSIRIIITPPWWMTWWFSTIAVITLAGIFGGSVRYITIQRYKRRLALEKERTRISKDMHDEVGSSLTKISILSEITKQNISNPEVAKMNIEKISESAGEVVDNISEIIWAINPKNDTLDNLLAYIREYTAETLEMKNIDYKIDLPENIPLVELSAETRRNIFLVVKEALINIVKYAEASLVNITAKIQESSLEITIKDNGQGFDMENTRRFGNGLINMRKRMDDIGGEFSLSSKTVCGTEIKLSVILIR